MSEERVKGMDYLVGFLPFLQREIIFVTSCLIFCIPVPFGIGACNKRERISPLEQILATPVDSRIKTFLTLFSTF